jgi:hypothetical protein
VPPRTAERSIRPAHRLVSAEPRRKPVTLHIQTQSNAQLIETRHQGRYRGRSRSLGLSPQYQQRCCRGQGVLSRGNQESGIGAQTIILNWYVASHRAAREMKAAGQLAVDTKLRSSKYLNNLIELDHRGVKLRIGPMLG